MRSPLQLTLLRGWALAGVWLAYGGLIYAAYRYALTHGQLPYALWPQLPVVLVIAFFVLSGLFALTLANLRRLQDQPLVAVAWGVAYTAAMSVGLVIVHVVVACANGDCL